MKNKKLFLSTFTVTGLIAISSCARQPTLSTDELPGFFMGIFHGFVILLSIIGSFFTDIRVYAFPNSGTMYDLGYAVGILLLICLSRAK